MKLYSTILIATLTSLLALTDTNTKPIESTEYEDQPIAEITQGFQSDLDLEKVHTTTDNIKKTSEKRKEKKKLEEKKYSFEKNGYYTQTRTNGKKVIFSNVGVIYENGIRYTYYSSRILHHYLTETWHLGKDGLYRDDDGYIIVASSDHNQGTIVDTPFGKGIVRDCGCASGTIDIYCAF